MAAIVEGDVVELDAAVADGDRLGAGAIVDASGWAWNSTSSSMSFTDFCRSRIYMPTSRR